MPLPDAVDTSVGFLKYYNGAFFMGHVNDGIFYSTDNGETWNEYNDGKKGLRKIQC